jgi:hypothetical protein
MINQFHDLKLEIDSKSVDNEYIVNANVTWMQVLHSEHQIPSLERFWKIIASCRMIPTKANRVASKCEIMHLDNPVKLDESHYSVFIKYLNYACKITWIKF